MNLVYIVSIPLVLFASFILFLLAYQTLATWKKYREEILLHLSLIFIFFASAIIGLMLIYILSGTSIEILEQNLFLIGFIYDLFYLEVSLFYISLFPNSHHFLEKYFPFIIGLMAVSNLFYSLLNPLDYFFVTLGAHFIVFLLGWVLIFQTYRKLKKSINYIQIQQEKDLIKFLEKTLLVVFLAFICDGIGFILWQVQILNLNKIMESDIIFMSSVFFLVVIIGYFIIRKIEKKARGIDFIALLNTIS